MSAQGAHKITEDFERELCAYTGAPYAVAVDNASNALWMCLYYHLLNVTHSNAPEMFITIPSHTYPSVPAEIILAGWHVKFADSPFTLQGEYQLKPLPVWDSALRFTADMYRPGQMQCVSFTGPYKHLKLGKGGAILLDSSVAFMWLKRARNSGRGECSYHDDTFTMLGRNCYMLPEIAARGIMLMKQFYNFDGTKKHNPDIALPYPCLSRFSIYTK